jgi:hypothetical protein
LIIGAIVIIPILLIVVIINLIRKLMSWF